MHCKVRTVNTQPKLYDYKCCSCETVQEVYDTHTDSKQLDCSCCRKVTKHKPCANGGTGYRYCYGDTDGSAKHFIGDM